MSGDIVTRLQMFSLDDGTDALNKLLAESADEIKRLRTLVQDFIDESDNVGDQARKLLGSPHLMWGCINHLEILTRVAEHALEGDWDYDPYEGCFYE